jgi:hypothetical protein
MHVYHASPHQEYFNAMEALMTAEAARPHWGKLRSIDAGYLSTAYRRFAEFIALCDRLDPERRFGNSYLGKVLGS